MNKRFQQVIVLIVAFLIECSAQNPELSSLAGQLQKVVVKVQTGTKSYEPKIVFVEPALIRYSYDEVDQKGDLTNYAYEFNLSDIDPYTVREQTQKDAIYVVLAVRNKQKLMKLYKNEEAQAYDEQAMIIAHDIENARAISDIIKKAIPLAEKVMASRLKLSGYEQMITWLIGNVKDVDLGSKSFTQSLAKTERPGSLRFTRVEVDDKTSTEEVYTFNLGDINVNSIAFKIAGNRSAISFEILQKTKFISVQRNGEVKPYENELTINTNNVDEARDLETVLGMAVPLAIEKVKADIPAVASEKDALQRIKTLTTEVTSGNKQISQSLEAECICIFTQVETDPKSSEKNVFKFNWIDINPNASVIAVTGDRLFVDVAVIGNKKLVMHTLDDKFNGYDNEVKIFMPDIENARRAKFAIDKAIEKCKASTKEPFGNEPESVVAWITNNIKEVELDGVTFKQTLEQVVPGKSNKLKYTRTEMNSKGAGPEAVNEFNLSDINPLSIEVEVKGKWLYVNMATDFKGKIIKCYKDGKIQPYTNTIDFVINDIDVSRNMISALKKAVKALKPD